MRVTFAAIEPALIEAWKQVAPAHINMHQGSILDLQIEAIVSPGNSFGFMDGGIDGAYTERFGVDQLQTRLQEMIRQKYYAWEMPVGEAIVVLVNDPQGRIGRVVCAPTMRVPMPLPGVLGVQNVYLATRAAIIQARIHLVQEIAFPGMGTGTGKVPYPLAANAMVAGVIDGLADHEFPSSLKKPWVRLQQIMMTGRIDWDAQSS